ncbi:hypothetical protein PESP_a0515 [Pseudoalteromonas espejiana DSM 9414]|nr:hypothetical protein PESP_a0515 [Pseudoalteromonas espejiana DSM 9414]
MPTKNLKHSFTKRLRGHFALDGRVVTAALCRVKVKREVNSLLLKCLKQNFEVRF